MMLDDVKRLRWLAEVTRILSGGHVSNRTLRKLHGKLSFAAFVLPNHRPFLLHLRKAIRYTGPRRATALGSKARADLLHWQSVLQERAVPQRAFTVPTTLRPCLRVLGDASSSIGLAGACPVGKTLVPPVLG